MVLPIRLVIPSLYAWKSAKYLEALEFMDKNVKGFWELERLSRYRRPLEGRTF